VRDLLQRRLEVPLLCRLLPLPRGGDVLELGCGSGNALEPLHRHLRPASMTGVDTVTSVGVVGDVTALPFATGAFDLVVDFGTCQHLRPEAQRVALDEVHRVLRPGGVFVHETWLAQLLAHPAHRPRSLRGAGAGLHPLASAGLWAAWGRDEAPSPTKPVGAGAARCCGDQLA
jgi:SAM-dependent methyltransferase